MKKYIPGVVLGLAIVASPAFAVDLSRGMEPYKNLGGDSGIKAYEIGSDFIRVQFLNESIYLYT